jgi:hypothetical protein
MAEQNIVLRLVKAGFLLAGGVIFVADSETAIGAKLSAIPFVPDGRPVTATDLVGKKICWTNGRTTTFRANGQMGDGHTQWSILQDGVVKIGESYYEGYVLSDGRFHARFHGGAREEWGTVCK